MKNNSIDVLSPAGYRQRATVFGLIAIAGAAASLYMGFDPSMLFTEFHYVVDLFHSMAPPNIPVIWTDHSVGMAVLETVSMCFLGTLHSGVLWEWPWPFWRRRIPHADPLGKITGQGSSVVPRQGASAVICDPGPCGHGRPWSICRHAGAGDHNHGDFWSAFFEYRREYGGRACRCHLFRVGCHILRQVIRICYPAPGAANAFATRTLFMPST